MMSYLVLGISHGRITSLHAYYAELIHKFFSFVIVMYTTLVMPNALETKATLTSVTTVLLSTPMSSQDR